MRSLPQKARIYVALMYLTGILALVATRLFPGPQAKAPLWELGLFTVLGVLAGSKKIRLMRHKDDEEAGSVSLGMALTFAAMLRFGPVGAVLVGTVSNLSSCLFPKRQPLYQMLFNIAIAAVEGRAASLTFLFVNGGTLDLEPLRTFPAVMISSLVFFAISTGGVATVIALCTGQEVLRLWNQTFRWTAPSYLAGACISTLAILIFGRHTGTVLLFVTPAIYLTYQSYTVYASRAEEKQKHIEELQVNQVQLADLYLATVKSLALAIDAKDKYTHEHILRVQRYAMATAKQLGLSGDDLEGLNTGALLHDIGKLGVPEYVLLKPGRLTDEEFAKIKKHPEIGAAILDPVEFPWPVLPVVKYHHEKWDGTGYPEGLKGEDIPFTARILAVADVYDALTSSRSYRSAWPHEKTVATIKNDAGTHFDPVIVDAFVQIIDGIVADMTREGTGPFSTAPDSKPATSKAEQAARDIYHASSELWALYEVAQTLSSSLGLQETLDILARKLAAILPETACLFLLKEDGSDALVARAAVGINPEFFAGCRTLSATGRSQTVVRTRQTYVGEYDSDDLLLISSQTSEWVPLHTCLIVPIVHQGTVLGTINLYHPQADAFASHDRQLLEMIAERAAMALYNGLLFDRTRSHAFTDPVTGLYNVRYLTQYVEGHCEKVAMRGRADEMHDEEAARATDAFALLCLDLDSFKPINDNFGHQKGDEVLCDLGRIFQETVREGDIVARYGGDEFLIVLTGVGLEEAEATAIRLQEAVITYDPGLMHPKLGALRLGVSIGYACFPLDGQDCATLLSAADSQMYSEKTERKLERLAGRGLTREAHEEANKVRAFPYAA